MAASPITIDTSKMREPLINQATKGLGALLNPNLPKNPPFDGRITKDSYAILGPRKPQLLRGRMGLWKPEWNTLPGASKKYVRSLDFLYNPSEISHSFEFDQSAVPGPSRNDQDLGRNLMTGQTINWSLLFNRTYEVAYNGVRGGDNADGTTSGVLADTKALEYMLGTPDGQGTQAVEVVVVFGATPGGKPWAFFGWIIQASISYLMFSHRMIPTVAKVDLSLARRWVDMTTVAAGDNTSTPANTTLTGENLSGIISLPGGTTGTSTRSSGPTTSTTTDRHGAAGSTPSTTPAYNG
jgi:hypothetical protein